MLLQAERVANGGWRRKKQHHKSPAMLHNVFNEKGGKRAVKQYREQDTRSQGSVKHRELLVSPAQAPGKVLASSHSPSTLWQSRPHNSNS